MTEQHKKKTGKKTRFDFIVFIGLKWVDGAHRVTGGVYPVAG